MVSLILSAFLATNAAPVMRTAAELTSFEKLNRTETIPFELEGTVIAAPAPDSLAFSVADTSGVARLLLSPAATDVTLSAGDHVCLSGQTDLADTNQFYCPSVDAATILGHGSPPEAPEIDARDFDSGRFDYRVVTVEGVVRETFNDEINREILLVVLQTKHGFVYAATGSAQRPCTISPQDILDRKIRLTGLVDKHPISDRAYLGRILSFNQDSGIRLLPPRTIDWTSIPDVSILRVEKAADLPSFDRHRAEGVVLAVWKARRRFMLRTLRGDVVYATLSPSVTTDDIPHPQTAVEVVGYPLSDAFTVALSQAHWRPSGRIPPPAETPIALSDEILTKGGDNTLQHIVAYNGHPVTLTGSVLRITSDESGASFLLLEAKQRIVKIPEGALDAPFQDITPGCRVRVTGIYSLVADASATSCLFPHATGFEVVPREPGDIVILSRPPWWTPARLLLLIGGLIAALVAILIWNRSLHRLAERRGREMSRRQLQAQRIELKRLERTKLAVELHDAISQSLTGISMQLKAVGAFTRQIPAEAAEHIGFAIKALGSCRTELRNVLWDLRHSAIDASSMNDAVRQTLEPHLGDVSLDVDFAIPRSRFDEKTAYSILRILRELVTNAIRHGHATALTIRADADQDARIVFTDNGIGFDPDNHPGLEEGHFGLVGIGERIETMNGTLSIDSSSSGTTVTIRFPL